MAKGNNKKSNGAARKSATLKKSRPARSTEVRNTARPRNASSKPSTIAVKPAVVTHAMIAQRAYDIHLSGQGGSQDDNWLRAERELRGL